MTDADESSDPFEAVNERCACLHVRQASRAVTRFYDDALRPVGLRSTQFIVMSALRLVGPVGITSLADELVMDRTTVTRNVDLLEEEGWVRRETGEDARVREVRLTEEGERKLEEAYPRWRAAQERVEEALEGGGFEQLLDGLDRAVEATSGRSA